MSLMSSLALSVSAAGSACKRRRRRSALLSSAVAIAAGANPAMAMDRRLILELTQTFGVSQLDATELVLIMIFMFLAAALMALVVGRALGELTFNAFVNTFIALGGALGGLHLYAGYALWHGGMSLGLSALSCLTGAFSAIIVLSALRNWLADETGAALAGGSGSRKPSGPAPERMRNVLAQRRPR